MCLWELPKVNQTLANYRIRTFIAKQRLGKQQIQVTAYVLATGSSQCHMKRYSDINVWLNTSTVTLRVVKGDGKGTHCRET
jgi:hypothetical protein